MTIVVVDDEKFDRYLVRRTLKEVAPDVSLVEKTDGEDFLSYLGSETFREECPYPPRTLILLDINMPRVGGFDVLEDLNAQLGAGSSNLDCAVIMMFTSSENPHDRERALSYDFVRDYIVKPIDHDNMRKLVESFQSTSDAA